MLEVCERITARSMQAVASQLGLTTSLRQALARHLDTRAAWLTPHPRHVAPLPRPVHAMRHALVAACGEIVRRRWTRVLTDRAE